MILDLCNRKDLKPIHVEPRAGEVKRLSADASRAKNLLGWEAEYNFNQGLKNFIQWYKSYGTEERIKVG